jgi:hypothetical protein
MRTVEHELLETEPAPHFLHFLDISRKSPQDGIVGLIGIVAAEQVVIHFKFRRFMYSRCNGIQCADGLHFSLEAFAARDFRRRRAACA